MKSSKARSLLCPFAPETDRGYGKSSRADIGGSIQGVAFEDEKAERKAVAKNELSYYHLYNISQQYDEIIQTSFDENPIPEQEHGKKDARKKEKYLH